MSQKQSEIGTYGDGADAEFRRVREVPSTWQGTGHVIQ